MVLILADNLEHGAHAWRKIGFLDTKKCLSQFKKHRLLLTCAPISELPSNIVPCLGHGESVVLYTFITQYLSRLELSKKWVRIRKNIWTCGFSFSTRHCKRMLLHSGRIRNHVSQLLDIDPDPDYLNLDPQPLWFYYLKCHDICSRKHIFDFSSFA